MGERKPTFGKRVETLEEEVGKLKRTAVQLRKDQSATRRLVRDLGKRVDTILPGVDDKLAAQTTAINEHVDEQLDQSKRFVLATLVDVARQWPAAAVVTATALATLAAAVLANWVLAAQHLPHIH